MDTNVKIGFDGINNLNQPDTTVTVNERNMSNYIKVKYGDIFQEPDSLKTFKFAWSLSKVFYKISKESLYLILSLFVAPILGILWGLTFAAFSFTMVWGFNPILKMIQMIGVPLQSSMLVVSQVFVEPLAYALGNFYSRFKVQHQELPPVIDKSTVIDIKIEENKKK